MGALEPFLVRTVLLRSEEFMAKDSPRLSGQRPPDGKGLVVNRLAVARMVRYAGRANRPVAVLVFTSHGDRIGGVYEFTGPFDATATRTIAGVALSCDAEEAIVFLNEPLAERVEPWGFANALAKYTDLLDIKLMMGGVLGPDTWWNGQQDKHYTYGGKAP